MTYVMFRSFDDANDAIYDACAFVFDDLNARVCVFDDTFIYRVDDAQRARIQQLINDDDAMCEHVELSNA